MIAGYDTTAITLCWLAYELAINPDVQDKLIAEVDENIGKVNISLFLSQACLHPRHPKTELLNCYLLSYDVASESISEIKAYN